MDIKNLDTTFRELNICSLTVRRMSSLRWFAEALRNSNLERVRSNIHASSEAALEELRAMLSGAPIGYVGCAKTTVSLGGHTTELIIVPPSGELGSPLPVKP